MSTSFLKLPILTASIATAFSLTHLAIAKPAQGNIINGSFEADPPLVGWMTSGDVSRQGTFQGVNPTDGSYQVLLTTASTTLLDDGFPPGSFNFSGSDPTGALPVSFDLQKFLGLDDSAFNIPSGLGFDYVAHEGSAIEQKFTVSEGQTLSFDWNFLTNDFPLLPFVDIRDYAFVTLYEENSTRSTVVLLEGSTGSHQPSSTSFNQETGFMSFSSRPLAAGKWVLGIGVVDIAGSDTTSALLVDNVQLKSQFTTVSEPSNLLGLVAVMGLSILIGARTT